VAIENQVKTVVKNESGTAEAFDVAIAYDFSPSYKNLTIWKKIVLIDQY